MLFKTFGEIQIFSFLQVPVLDVIELAGGHTDTLGKGDLEIGFVSTVVEMGFSLQELKRLLIKMIDMTKLRATMIVQNNLLKRDLNEEM